MEDKFIPFHATPLPESRHVLTLAPHPDDEVFGPGGSLALYAASGTLVTTIVVTDGAFGQDPSAKQAHIALREQESITAANALGIPVPIFWRYSDRGLIFGESLVQRIIDAIADCNADIVFAPALTEMHPDHRALALSAIEAVRRKGGTTRLALYEIGVAMPSPSLLIDITSVFDKKAAAMQCFPSQLASQNYSDQIIALNKFRTFSLPKTVDAAEAIKFWDPQSDALEWHWLFESEYRRREKLGLPGVAFSQHPAISVIIRSMDRPLLREALDSVACQLCEDIEVLVINAKGGRHSEIGEDCGPFALRLLNQEGLPLKRAAAANFGLDFCAGRYAIFLDDDDLLAPNHISKLFQSLEMNPLAPAAYTGVWLHKDGKIIREQYVFWEQFRLFGMNFLPIHSVMFRTNLTLEAPPRFDESFEALEDWDFWLQVCNFGDFLQVPGSSATYRLDAGNSGLSSTRQIELFRREHQKVLSKWQSRAGIERVSNALIWFSTAVDGLTGDLNALRCNSQERTEQFQRHAGHLQSELSQAQEHSAHLQSELSQAQQHSTHLQSELSQAQQHSTHLQSELSQVQQLSAHLQSELSEAQQHSAHLQSELSQAQQRSNHLQSELSQAQQHSAHLQSELSQAQQHSSHTLSELSQAQHNSKAALTELSRIQQDFNQRVSELLQARQLISDLQEELARKGNESSSLKEQIEASQLALNKANTERNLHEQRFFEIVNSRSWKITLPLRTIGLWIRPLKSRAKMP